MVMFIILNLTCGFGLFAKKSRFKSQQHIRGSGGLRSQWGCFLWAAAEPCGQGIIRTWRRASSGLVEVSLDGLGVNLRADRPSNKPTSVT